jgi:hypothetical protein
MAVTVTLTDEQIEDLISAVQEAVRCAWEEHYRIATAPTSDGYLDLDVEVAWSWLERQENLLAQVEALFGRRHTS